MNEGGRTLGDAPPAAGEQVRAEAQQGGDQPARKPSDYKSGRRPVWCAGCGDYGVMNSIFAAFSRLNLDQDRLVVSSGIGCSSRMPGYMRTYGIHGAHGRAIPIATGVKVANPGLDVLVVGGDGDGFSIGTGHLPHAVRRNVNMTYVMVDNEIYGLTKGQVSPTSPSGARAKSAPYGTVEAPANPMLQMLAYGVSFAARGFAADTKQLADLVEAAMQHRGFAFVHALSPCVSFNRTAGYDYFKERLRPIPETHRTDDQVGAIRLAIEADCYHVGIFYKDDRPEYTEMLERRVGRQMSGPPVEVEALVRKYS